MKKFLTLIFAIIFTFTMLTIPALAEADAPAVTIDLTQIVVGVIGLVFSLLVTWLAKAIVPPVKKWLEAKTTKEQRDILTNLTRQLVHAAEQLIGKGKGNEKLEYVKKHLNARGFDVDYDVIEACVKEMNDMALTELLGEPVQTSPGTINAPLTDVQTVKITDTVINAHGIDAKDIAAGAITTDDSFTIQNTIDAKLQE